MTDEDKLKRLSEADPKDVPEDMRTTRAKWLAYLADRDQLAQQIKYLENQLADHRHALLAKQGGVVALASLLLDAYPTDSGKDTPNA